MSEQYIMQHYADIVLHAADIENRPPESPTAAELIAENQFYWRGCKQYGLPFVWIDEGYEVDFELKQI